MSKDRIIIHLLDVAHKYRMMALAALELSQDYTDIADDLEAAAEIIEGGDAG